LAVHLLRRLALAALLVLAAAGAAPAADELSFFQLGTGPAGGTRFPFGGLIASALSNPPGSLQCERGGPCGPPGMVVVARSSAGSTANVKALADRRLDAAMVDAETAFAAISGQGAFAGTPVTNLRAIATLYPESLHLVVRRAAGIHGLRQLKGRRVAVDPAAANAGRLVLAGWGLAEKDVKTPPMSPAEAASAMAAGRLDAFLALGPWPIAAIAELARGTAIDLLPLAGPDAERLLARHPFLSVGEIGGHTYEGVAAAVPTLEIGVLLLTRADLGVEAVAGITRALWHPGTAEVVSEGSVHGARLRLDADAPARLGIPPHPGAVRTPPSR